MERKTVRLREEHLQRIEETPTESPVPLKPFFKGSLPFKSRTNEIIWHKKEAIHAVDYMPYKYHVPQKLINQRAATNGARKIARLRAQGADKHGFRMATGGVDMMVRVWIISHDRAGEISVNHKATLSRHEKGIGAVRFSPVTRNGRTVLASAADDSYILIWVCHPNGKPAPVFGADPDEDFGSELWKCESTLRGHIEDVVDLSWSANGKKLASCGIDNSVIVWDPWNKTKLAQLTNHTHYVQGVSVDPLGKLYASLSADRSMRCWVDRKKKTKKKDRFVSKAAVSKVIPTSEHEREVRLFWDDTLVGFVRRLQWCPVGLLLACPGAEIGAVSDPSRKGRKPKDQNNAKNADENAMETDVVTVQIKTSNEGGTKQKPERKNCVAIFTRRNLKKPMFLLNSPEPVLAVRWCPILYAPKVDPKTGMEKETILKIPFRMLLAAICESSVVLYDSHDFRPIARISDCHYANMTDAAWSNCGSHLMVSSRDGYLSTVYVDPLKMGPILGDSAAEMRAQLVPIINRRVKIEAFVKRRRANKKKEMILAAKEAEKAARKQARDEAKAAAKLERQKEKEAAKAAAKQALSIAAAFKKAEKAKKKEDSVKNLTTGMKKTKIVSPSISREMTTTNSKGQKVSKKRGRSPTTKKTTTSKSAARMLIDEAARRTAAAGSSTIKTAVEKNETVNTLIPKKKSKSVDINDKKRKSTFDEDEAESANKKRKAFDPALLTQKLEELNEDKTKSPKKAQQEQNSPIIIDENVELPEVPKADISASLPKPELPSKTASKNSSTASVASSSSSNSKNGEPTMTTPTNKVVKIAPIFLLSGKKKTPSTSSSSIVKSSSGGSVRKTETKKKMLVGAAKRHSKEIFSKLKQSNKIEKYTSPRSSADTTPVASAGPSSPRSLSPGPSKMLMPPIKSASSVGVANQDKNNVDNSPIIWSVDGDATPEFSKPTKKVKKKVKLTTISSNPSI